MYRPFQLPRPAGSAAPSTFEPIANVRKGARAKPAPSLRGLWVFPSAATPAPSRRSPCAIADPTPWRGILASLNPGRPRCRSRLLPQPPGSPCLPKEIPMETYSAHPRPEILAETLWLLRAGDIRELCRGFTGIPNPKCAGKRIFGGGRSPAPTLQARIRPGSPSEFSPTEPHRGSERSRAFGTPWVHGSADAPAQGSAQVQGGLDPGRIVALPARFRAAPSAQERTSPGQRPEPGPGRHPCPERPKRGVSMPPLTVGMMDLCPFRARQISGVPNPRGVAPSS